ncbi:MAG: nicotinate-nucleotide adenylyltransferase [Proteobacteria bacterium]|nr:nicotinate-nucleotide adenylyltransferase [Pseudomonadota bacterium]
MSLARESPLVGLFGGTFNPIHVGHLRAAQEVLEALDLSEIRFLPSARPPHKQACGADTLASPAERLAWVEAAVADNPAFVADPTEIRRSEPSYTVDTLAELGPGLGPAPPVFLIGWDAFLEIGTWREPERLLTLAHFAVMTRPPATPGLLSDAVPAPLARAFEFAPDGDEARHREAGTWIRRLEITALDVSSSDIRARLRAGRSVRYLLPERVRSAVEASGVYAAGAAGHPLEERKTESAR